MTHDWFAAQYAKDLLPPFRPEPPREITLNDQTPTEELRAAAVKVRAALRTADTARVTPNENGSMETVVICDLHADPLLDTDASGSCANCEFVETFRPPLAALIAALVNAREPLAAWLEHVAYSHDGLNIAADKMLDRLADVRVEADAILRRGPYDMDDALEVARVINGADRG